MTESIQERVDEDIRAVNRLRCIKKLQKEYSEYISKADTEQNESESERCRKLAEAALVKMDALGGKPLPIEQI